MSNKKRYTDICEQDKSIPLFLRPEWLDAILDGQKWDVSISEENNEIIGALPYQIKKRWGLTAYTSPWMTPPTNPWIKNLPEEVTGKSLGRYHRIISELLSQIEPAHYQNFRISTNGYTGHAWSWNGYELYTQYTYRLPLTATKTIFDNMKNTLRTDIRNGEKSLQIEKIESPEEFYGLLQKQVGYNYELLTLERIKKLFSLKRHMIALKAIDKNEVVGCSLFVKDKRRIYYLIGARVKPGANLAMTAMLWHIIQTFSGQDYILDFEGSMIQGVERYFRGFGGIPHPTLNPIKMPKWMKFVM